MANLIEERLIEFKSLMEPALHLFPKDIIDILDRREFFIAPASTKFHCAYSGGLYKHSKHVTETLLNYTDQKVICQEWKRPESPYIIGMFHDLCKIDNYIVVPDGYSASKYEYTTKTDLKGHGDKSVMLLSEFISLTSEEIMCIRYHMGAFTDKEEWPYYTRAVKKYPNLLWVHQADMYATHILDD